MNRFRVLLAGSAIETERHRRALASLPNHFEIVESERADIYLHSQSDGIGEYPNNSALVLDEPTRMFEPIFEHVRVLPAFQYLPLIQEIPTIKAGSTFSLTNIEITCLNAHTSESSIASCLFEILAIIRVLTGKAADVDAHTKIENGLLIAGHVADESTSFAISIFRSPLNFGEINILGVSKSERVSIAIQSDQTAQPGKIRLFDKTGSSQSWPLHQNSHRLTWLAAYKLAAKNSSSKLYNEIDLEADCSAAKMVPLG